MRNYDLKNVPWTRWWVRVWLASMSMSLLITPAQAQSSSGGGGPLSGFVTNLVQGLNLIIAFGFIAGCTMVIAGVTICPRGENLKKTVIFVGRLGLARALALQMSCA